jgi:ribosomal protein S18 acetylase RimI-like enzyme
MQFDFDFKTIDTEKEVRNVVDFIRQFPLNYFNYSDWTDKVYYQLMNGNKSGIFCLSHNKDIVADLIFQSIGGGVLEIKNLRVYDFLQNRGFAHFMLRQLEKEGTKEFNGIMVDTRKDNLSVRNLLEKRGYKEINQANLYDKTFLDVVYYKKLNSILTA